MKTGQPSYWCVANIGDADPVEHGGKYVLVDRTGVYNPVLLILCVHENDVEPGCKHTLHHVELEPCIKAAKAEPSSQELVGLSTNRFHPYILEWFGDPESLKAVAGYVGRPVYSLLDSFLSSCPVERAFAYDAVASYHGLGNFDQSPQALNFQKAELLADAMQFQIEESETWHQGYRVYNSLTDGK